MPISSLALLAVIAGAGPSPPKPLVLHQWRPLRDGSRVVAIAVTTVLEGWPEQAGSGFSLNVPVTYAGVRAIADRTVDLAVTDRAGQVPLRIEDDPADPGGFPFYRHIRAERAVAFPVTIRYRSLAPDEAQRAPPFGLYSYGGGVTGAGSGFLVLPEWPDSVTSRIHWDLGDLPPGAIAASSFGEGDVEVSGPIDQLRHGWIMAGALGRYPARGGRGFTAYWLGTPAFDPVAEMAWAERMYRYLARAYRTEAPAYRVFVRVAPAGRPGSSSGTALGASFLMGAPAREGGAAPHGEAARETIAHEMGHLFVGGIEAPVGVDSWFSEGLNTYYTRLLRMRGGFIPFDAYLAEVNEAYAQYYRSPARNLSADSIVRIGFGDEEVRHMPYLRGSFYFADLDSKIRAWSHGRRGLDRMIRELFARRRRGERFDHAAWIAAVERDAGPGAGAEFEAIVLRGERTVIPAAEAFGPGLVRRELKSHDGRVNGYAWARAGSSPGRT